MQEERAGKGIFVNDNIPRKDLRGVEFINRYSVPKNQRIIPDSETSLKNNYPPDRDIKPNKKPIFFDPILPDNQGDADQTPEEAFEALLRRKITDGDRLYLAVVRGIQEFCQGHVSAQLGEEPGRIIPKNIILDRDGNNPYPILDK